MLTDWDDDDPLLRNNPTVRQERTVVLKGLFTLEELKVSSPIRLYGNADLVRLTLAIQEDVEAILDIKEDVRNECNKIGEVTNVVLYDLEPEGVVTVKFAQPEDAQTCVTVCCVCPFSSLTSLPVHYLLRHSLLSQFSSLSVWYSLTLILFSAHGWSILRWHSDQGLHPSGT